MNPVVRFTLLPTHRGRDEWNAVSFAGRFCVVVVVLAFFVSSASAVDSEAKLTTNLLRAALDKPVGRSWQSVPIRDAFRELAETNRVSILLDRNFDPATELTLLAKPQPLRDLIAEAAHAVNAASTPIGNVIYVGAPESVVTLRQLLELRTQELTRITSEQAKGPKNPWPAQRAALHKKQSLVWDDLDRPREVLKLVAEKFSVQLEGIDQLPHDLWAAGSLPQMSLVESLSLLLIPFGATFELIPDRFAIQIKTIPQELLDQSNKLVTTKPDSKSDIDRTPAKKATSPTKGRPADILTKKFNFQVQNATLRDVIQSLRNQGVSIVANEQDFVVVDLSFDKKVDLDVTGKTAEAICRQLIKPFGGEVDVSGNTIYLRPKRSP